MDNLSSHLRSTLSSAYNKIRSGELRTLIPFLGLFRINGKPMNLHSHYQFAPLYNCIQPSHMVFMCGRQLGKSYAICSDFLIRAMLIPFYHTLIVQPRADQIQRLIGTVYKPLLMSCPVKDAFISKLEMTKLALREFKSGSLAYADHTFMDQGARLRGISAAASVAWDETQNIEYEALNIGNETMSASMFWGFAHYTGTPLTTDTTLALLWARSSQAEWIVRCTHCNHLNVPNPENDLLKMIGKNGPICAKCGKDIQVANGGYVHAIPDRALTFPGYHVSQTIHPIHTTNENKWRALLTKVDSYTTLPLYNEVFGWPYDASTSPLTLADLQKATHDIPEIKSPLDTLNVKDKYRYITVGVDWGGGGAVSDSYTAVAVIGLRANSDVIDVLYGKRMPKGMSPTDEVHEIMTWISTVGADAFAFDNGGAGFVRLEMMKQAGLMELSHTIVVPINYVSPRSGDVMSPHPAKREPDLYYYSLDKSRSLAVCITAIKSLRIRFPKFNEQDEQAVVRDFLALRENPTKSLRNETIILIGKKPGVPDDFAHAVNMGCAQIWDHFGAYPRIGSRYDTSALDFDDNDNKIMDPEVFGPRGDFERFADAVEAKALYLETGDDLYE